MKPPERVFEKVSTSNFIPGVITDIKYEQEHEFSYKGVTKTETGVKLIFNLVGHNDPKSSGWLKLNYGEKTNLYKKYISSLVEGAKPYIDFDLDQLKGMKVNILFIDSPDGKFQYIDTIRPADKKVVPDAAFESDVAPF